MKVMIIPSWYPRDRADVHASFVREHAEAVRDAGCEVSVLSATLAPLRRPLSALRGHGRIRYAEENGIPVWRWTGSNLLPRAEGVRAAMTAGGIDALYARHADRHGVPDVIHLQSALPAGIGARRLARRIGRPLVLTEHASAYHRGRIGRHGRGQAREVALGAARRFAVSQPFADQLPGWLDMTTERWEVLPNLIDDLFLAAPLPRRHGPFGFLHISNLTPNKRVADLIHAFHRAFGPDSPVSLTIGGDGPDRAALQALVAELGLGQRVHFLGRLSRTGVRDAMARADCFVLPSAFETFGVVLIEALAMGRPVIATRCGGPQDIVGEGDGLLVPPMDADALTSALSQMAERRAAYDPAMLRQHCANRFSAAAVGRRWVEVYQDVVTRP